MVSGEDTHTSEVDKGGAAGHEGQHEQAGRVDVLPNDQLLHPQLPKDHLSPHPPTHRHWGAIWLQTAQPRGKGERVAGLLLTWTILRIAAGGGSSDCTPRSPSPPTLSFDFSGPRETTNSSFS